MKPGHRLLVIAAPLVIIGVAFFFHHRAENERVVLEQEVQRLDRQALLERGEARLEAERNAEFARQEEDTVLAQKAFWAFAIGLGVFFLILACAFVVAERRHSKARDELIASFVPDDISEPSQLQEVEGQES